MFAVKLRADEPIALQLVFDCYNDASPYSIV